jgi:hypothetical protein
MKNQGAWKAEGLRKHHSACMKALLFDLKFHTTLEERIELT